MLKIFLLTILVYGIYRLIRFYQGIRALGSIRQSAGKIGGEEMLACSKCNTFVAKQEAIDYEGQVFCSGKCKGA